MLINMIKARQIKEMPTIEEARANFEEVGRLFPVAEDVQCDTVDAGGIPAEWLSVPGATDERDVLYLHGGGYTIGSLETHRDLASRIGRAARARVLSIDYRLAPEHPHPAAVEDSVTAYRWTLSQGIDPAKMVIAGDSAGGGLTVATLLALRDAGEPMPTAGVCLSPWVDLAVTGESVRAKADIDPIVNADATIWMANLYAGDEDPCAPLISPLYADLQGLPPLLIQVGTAEILMDDATRFADRARPAGVDITLETWEHMVHVWQYFAAMLPEGQEAIDRIGEYIIKHTS
jgi:acetyl esterase/lipase